MKKIVLFGDSIRMGYQNYVRDALSEVAQVYAPQDSSRFAQHMLRFVYDWKVKEHYPDDMDLVHWNVGLWDVIRIFDEALTPPEFYKEMLIRLENRLRQLFPKAKQIFALSTSVVEKAYVPPYQRYNADIEKYNSIAMETLAPLGVEFNDLYTLTKNVPDSFRSDMTHFYTEDGIKLVGGQVVNAICNTLNLQIGNVQDVSTAIPELSQEQIGR